MGSRKVKKMATGGNPGVPVSKLRKAPAPKKPDPKKPMPELRTMGLKPLPYLKSRAEEENDNEIKRHLNRNAQFRAEIEKDPDYMSAETYRRLKQKQKEAEMDKNTQEGYKRATGKASGGKIKGYASGGMPKAKKGRRGDGICQRGRTKGRMV